VPTLSRPRYFVYIRRCADASLYAGYTTDLARRLVHHNTAKRGARYTRSRRPVVLKYSESFPTLSAALKREAQIKSWSRAQKLAFLRSAKRSSKRPRKTSSPSP